MTTSNDAKGPVTTSFIHNQFIKKSNTIHIHKYFVCIASIILLFTSATVDATITAETAASIPETISFHDNDQPLLSFSGSDDGSAKQQQTTRESVPFNLNINISMDMGPLSWSIHKSETSVPPAVALEAIMSVLTDEGKRRIKSDLSSGVSLISRILEGEGDDTTTVDIVTDANAAAMPPPLLSSPSSLLLSESESPPTIDIHVPTDNNAPLPLPNDPPLLIEPLIDDDTSFNPPLIPVTNQPPRRLEQDCPVGDVTALIRVEVSNVVDGIRWELYDDENDLLLKSGGEDYIFDVDQSWYVTDVCVDKSLSCYRFGIVPKQHPSTRSNGDNIIPNNVNVTTLSSYQKYEIVIDGKIESDGTNVTVGYVTRFGRDCSKCGRKPLLAPINEYNQTFDERTNRIMTILTGVSGMDDFVNVYSPEYRAACWIIFDDERALTEDYTALVQRYVLALLYYATNGEGWNLGDWDKFLTGDDECSWSGISCAEGLVNGIMLGTKNLKGHIPVELSKLFHLSRLDLPNNLLSGTIPSELAELSTLTLLRLSKNSLEGTIPSNLGQLFNIQTIELHVNNLSGSIPSELGQLDMLKVLKLDGNRLNVIPEELFNITTLEEFTCVANDLVGTISSRIVNLRSIETLYLSHNKLSGSIPSNMNISSLRYLYLDHNQLRGNLLSIGRLENVKELRLQNNNFVGTIPDEIKELKSLLKLDISSNKLHGTLPSSLRHLIQIQSLSLHQNQFIGNIPSFLGNLPMLHFLRLQQNNFQGTVPENLCTHFGGAMVSTPIFITDCADQFLPPKVKCSCCTSCSGPFSLKNRTGSCPGGEIIIRIPSTGDDNSFEDILWFLKSLSTDEGDAIQEQTVLQDGPYEKVHFETNMSTCISLTNCFSFETYLATSTYVYKSLERSIYFKDPLLSAEGNETIKLIQEGVDGAQFGYVSDNKTMEIGRCDNVEIVTKASESSIIFETGTRDRAILDSLIRISGPKNILYRNESSPISYQYQAGGFVYDDLNLINLQRYVLALLYYSTHGSQWTNNKNWLNTDVSECEWYGIECEQIDGVSVIRNISLPNNNLHGSLFFELGELSVLKRLDLSGNSIKSTIPSEMGNLWSLNELNLGNNALHGTIPNAIQNLLDLEILNMKNNNLQGSIPDLEDLKHLMSVDISGNELHGRITETSLNYRSLVRLDLRDNVLFGSIPSIITVASDLEELDLSNNQLTGSLPHSIGNLKSLLRLSLNRNHLAGSIPDGISEIKNLTHLMLQSNQISGFIPTKIGNLVELVNMSLSYNAFRGSIPFSLSQLKNLQLFHIHSNQLEGTIESDGNCNQWRRENALIADCGDPSTFKVDCQCCSECCNSEEECQINQPGKMSPLDVTFITTGILCLVLFMGASAAIYLVKKEWAKMFFNYDVNAIESCGDESVYFFLLTRNPMSWIITVGTIMMQVSLFTIFLNASSLSHQDSDWVYTKKCPENELECSDDKEVSLFTYILCIIFVILGLLPDLINGVKLIHKSIAASSFPCLVAGIVLLFITMTAFITSIFYNYAIAENNTEVLINAAVLLFINDIDERMYDALVSAFPKFVLKLLDEANTYSDGLVDVDEQDNHQHERLSIESNEDNYDDGRHDCENDKRYSLKEINLLKEKYESLEKLCNIICDQVEILSKAQLDMSKHEEKIEEQPISPSF